MARIGRALRDARNDRGISIETAAQDTRISPRFLQALESERFEELPAPVYVRGFLRSYANYLHIDPEPLIADLAGTGAGLGGADGFTPGAGQRRNMARGGGVVPADSAPPRTPGGGWQPPRPTTAPQHGRNDPFQRRAASMPAPPPSPQWDEDEEWEDDENEDLAPAPPPAPRRAASPPFSARSSEDEEFEDEEPYRPQRIAGVLLERPDDREGGGTGTRLLAVIGAAVVLLIAAAGVGALLLRGGGDNKAAAPAATATPATRTVVAIGPGATPSATASASASPSASAAASPTGTPDGATPAGTPTTGATPTPPPPTPTPRATDPTPTPVPATPTPTVAPPTPTPVPPTPTPTLPPTPRPTPTPIQAHPYGLGMCANSDCGAKPYIVVCPPDGSWFVNVNGAYPVPAGWRSGTTSDASAIGPSVCR